MEHQPQGGRAFWRATVAAGWLEYRTLRYQPINLVLAAVQQWTVVGVWYFTGQFLSVGANHTVQAYGGNYVAYVAVGVILNQIGLAALNGPLQTVSDAFWDKRLETYRLASQGIWANLIGRLGWQVLFTVLMQGVALLVLVLVGAIPLHAGGNVLLVVLISALLVGANAGLGIAGASLFFLLEVKSGQDPLTWAYRYLVMLVSGLYVPLTLLPGWLRGMGAVLPQTYGFAAMRALVLGGSAASASAIASNLLGLAITTLVAMCGGYGLFTLALHQAERQGGMGVVV